MFESDSFIETRDGLMWLDYKLLDDKNMPGKTLGQRRLQTPKKDFLYPLRSMITDFGHMLQSGKNCFIDSKGIAFKYVKTKVEKVQSYRIRKVEYKQSFCLLYLAGVEKPLEIYRPPPQGYMWAGILHFSGIPWAVYNYSVDREKAFRRKI